MRNFHAGNLAVTSLLILVLFLLTSCAGGQKPVRQYHDSSYTKSVATASPEKSEYDRQPTEKVQPPLDSTVTEVAVQPPSHVMTSGDVLTFLTLVDDRIVEYEAKMQLWKKISAEALPVTGDEEQQHTIAGCRNRIERILSGYNALHQRLINESNGAAVDTSVIKGFLTTERDDMAFLESNCQRIVMAGRQGEDWIADTRGRLLEERERDLNEKMASGAYEEVVRLYEMLPVEKGQHPTFEASYSYGQALLRLGRVDDAATVFQNLLVTLQEQNQIEQEFKLMQLIADIQFGLKHYDAAFERYIDIINRYAGLGENIDWARKQQSVISVRNSHAIEVRNFAELILASLTSQPEHDGFRTFLLAARFQEAFPDSSLLPTVKKIRQEAGNRAEAWFALTMQRINVFREEKKYQEALQTIAQLPMNDLPDDKKEVVNTLHDELITASFREEESRRQARYEALQEIWTRGQELLGKKEYDQAIAVYSTLVDTAFRNQAAEKIIEASQLAAQEGRREAAELFVLAGKTGDSEKRITLLFQSRQLLLDILQKYPQSGLVEKTEKNLERIEQEIRTIDPALLRESVQPENEREGIQQLGETATYGGSAGSGKVPEPTGFPQQ